MIGAEAWKLIKTWVRKTKWLLSENKVHQTFRVKFDPELSLLFLFRDKERRHLRDYPGHSRIERIPNFPWNESDNGGNPFAREKRVQNGCGLARVNIKKTRPHRKGDVMESKPMNDHIWKAGRSSGSGIGDESPFPERNRIRVTTHSLANLVIGDRQSKTGFEWSTMQNLVFRRCSRLPNELMESGRNISNEL